MARQKFGIIESVPRLRTCRWPIFLEKLIQLFPDLSCAQFRCSAQRNENNVHPGRHDVPIHPEVFSEPSLDPISSTSFPDFLAGRDSQPSETLRVREHPDLKVISAAPGSLFRDLSVFRRPTYSALFRELSASDFRLTNVCVPLPFFS